MSTNIVCFASTLRIFRIYQVFPAKGQELRPRTSFFIKFGLTCLLASAILVGSFLHFIYSLQTHQHNYIYKDISYVLSMLTGYTFFVLFSFNTKSAAKLFIFLSDFEKFGKPPKFEERNEQLNRFSRYHYIYISLASLAFLSVTNIFKSDQCRKENEEYGLDEVCGLITNAWLPFDIDYFPAKHIYASLQVFSIFYVYVTAGMVTWLIVEIVEHISIRIDHIKYLFVRALNERDPEEMRRRFRFAVQYHSYFLGLEEDLNNCFSNPMFSMMLLGAAILGCASFGYIETGSNSLLVICLSWFNALSLVSFGGQRLTNENLAIAEEIYNATWPNAMTVLGKEIIIVLIRCQKPMKLRAAAFGVMNHAMIVSVSRAAYSYLNILRASS